MRTVLLSLADHIVLDVDVDTQYVLEFGSTEKAECVLELNLTTSGVTAEIYGFYNLGSTQSVSLTTITRHIAPHTSCMTRIKGVLNDSASSSYVGKILIEKKAQQTSSFLSHDVLVIGNKTHNNSQPILEIEADDVKASHGATTGRIDKMQLYYLMSRGFTLVEAQTLIIQGFFEAALNTIADSKVVEEVATGLYKRV